MSELRIYITLLTGVIILFGWWLFNHFDGLFNLQLKVHDDIITKILSIDKRIENLEKPEDIVDEEIIDEHQEKLEMFF
jgi:hypothetical protein